MDSTWPINILKQLKRKLYKVFNTELGELGHRLLRAALSTVYAWLHVHVSEKDFEKISRDLVGILMGI